ncbi:HAMP domain-containing sensor histidine kinase [Geobacillus sp. TFV-3]|uniref:HAMP domain-containing sensor histidine kinase n=1 Tax=Geobacillus sp. TFV-3 TaxID=1897059 RepID=UPI001358D435|nr:HAMP domain-containing sensor histidine kinase [Geobacillus sp. TFV-3]KAF0993641.1 Sensor histidine kinase ResE [Geobacillus sp. TFV-3]
MKNNKTIKRDFYLLVVKVVLATIVSSALAYLCLIYLIVTFTGNHMVKSTDYFVRYLDLIEKKVKENEEAIFMGRLIPIDRYSRKIQGEVVDVSGHHLYGDRGIVNDKVDISEAINRDIVKGSYVYRFVPIKHDNAIQAVYVLKAPFGFMINNRDHFGVVLIYVVLLISPLIFFIVYLIFFTSRLYQSLFHNMKLLLHAADNISNGYFDFKVSGLKRKEFIKIQDSFNTMISALKEMVESLSKVDDERKIMVSSIAHDIRTPLTVIQGQMDLIDDLKDADHFDITPHLDLIRKNCRKMRMLTDNLSLLYKVENPHFLFNPQQVDLYQLLMEKKKEISALVSNQKQINISFDVDLRKTFYILDEPMLMRVLDNLLYNSLRFTKSGEIKLKVYDEADGQNHKIYFKCSDTGTGFKETDTSLLFRPFYQNEQYKDHFGLGLYIAKQIVKNYGGEIWAYNNESGGATVEFYIKEISNDPHIKRKNET